MFCPNCGVKLPDGAAFCSNCGTRMNNQSQQSQQPQQPQQPQQQYQPQQQQYQPQQPQQPQYQQPQYDPQVQYQQPPYGYPQYPRKKKTGLIVGIIASVAVVAAVALILVFTLGGSGGGASSPVDALESFFDAYKDGDADTVAALFPEFELASIAQSYNLSSDAGRDEIADVIKSGMDYAKAYMQYFSVSDIKVDKTVSSSDSGFDDYLNECISDYGFDKDDYDIEAFAELSYSVSYSIDVYSFSDSSTLSGLCVKIDGDWYIVYCDFGTSY